jgi:hypothetical protein
VKYVRGLGIDKKAAHLQNFHRAPTSQTLPNISKMPKRKRSSPVPSERTEASPLDRQTKHCAKRLAQAQKPLLAGIKRGATIERQKYSRRKKYAVAKNQKTALYRIEAEYEVLKALNLEQLADQHLRKTLARVKRLKDAEPLQEYLAGIRQSPHDTNTLNVTARIFKTPAVQKEVDAVITDLKGILGARDNGEKAQKEKEEAKKPKVETQVDEEIRDVDDDEDDPYMAFSARIAAPSSGEESEASVSDDERPPSIGDSEIEYERNDDLQADGASSDEEEAEASGDEGDVQKQPSHSIASPSGVSSSPASDASETDEAPIPRTKAPKAADFKSGTSAFLPALSHAAYFSGSESEASDIDEAPRKNRRGQRARQKIAEAKFGAGAKHLEKQQQNVKWDSKRGAVGDKHRGKDRKERRGRPMGRGPAQSGGNAEPLGDKKDRKIGEGGVKRDDKGELHPSWLAAKAVKESKKLKIGKDGKGAVGTKVVFD